MRTITVLGAGLSGLTAAINLAKEGYEVEVYEKNKDVGMRFHGDLQGLENWSEKKDILEQLKEMGIKISFDCAPFSNVIVTNCSKARKISSRKPLFYLVRRGSFLGTIDYGLKDQALKSGVKIHFQKPFPKCVDIVATGPNPNEVPGVVKGIVFETSIKDIAIVVLNDRLAFKGYSYLLITKGYGCLCSVVLHELYRVNECFERTKEFFMQELNLRMRSPIEVGGVGSFSLRNEFQKGKMLFVGEAAGLQDFLWGFGMRFAIKSGYLAAQSIIKNMDYNEIVEKHFRTKLEAAVVYRYLWEDFASRRDYSFMIYIAEFLKKNQYHSLHGYFFLPKMIQKMIYPIALFHTRKKYPKLKL